MVAAVGRAGKSVSSAVSSLYCGKSKFLDKKLSDMAVELFTAPDNKIYLSVILLWEILLKNSLGRLFLPDNQIAYLSEQRKKHRIASLDLEENAILQLHHLPYLHNDPFDRILICQSMHHGLTLLTPDENIQKYPVKTVW
ncbi:MAG: type II toxin-antitoxin system VapC family toxin [Spirochaetales bacterium]|nr:type II toxin-antitoxin system VapC family toxin [Spirochaetales bacterium]